MCKFLKVGESPLHKKPYFPGPGISWKAQKDQVNITFTSTFWLKKDRIFHRQMSKTGTFW